MDSDTIYILIVDDVPQNLLVLEKYLHSPDITIIKAASGNQALGHVLEYDFALILMDVQMPEMDGFETAELIRQNDSSKHIPIIFITAISKDQKHIFKGYKSGAVDYIFKPFDPDILQSKVSVFIKLHQQKIELENVNQSLELRVKERTSELHFAKEKAEQANVAKSRFLSNISHELLTPLHQIVSYSSFGINSSQQEEFKKQLKYFTTIKDCSHKLQSLLQDLLDLSQFQSGNVSYAMRESCMESIINGVVGCMSTLIRDNSITVTVEKLTTKTTIWADHEKMTNLLLKLISNAIKFSAHNGTIAFSLSESEIISEEKNIPALLISIQDQGIGIPGDELITIFDSFSESSFTATQAGGKGLGLAICREIVNAHHGKIWAENVEKGALFKILLPYQQQANE
ncbi:hybrid sensor histidine kinase/response regulator [bacterium]|nr:hybrid sensor histidine kinase/response regulator [bacterium]